MPRTGKEYCTEEELLAIANKIREAGGAEVLEAFMPSRPSDPSHCLIANALNFGCQVASYPNYRLDEHYNTIPIDIPDGFGTWGMHLPTREIAQMVADTMGWHYDPDHAPYTVRLPERVGNTAAAFDSGQGWTAKYVSDRL